MNPIQLVVFDMAGTTVKDAHEVLACFLDAAESTGLAVGVEQVNPLMGWPKRRVFQTLWGQQIGEQHPDYETAVEQSFQRFRDVLEHHYQTQPIEPTEGCLEVFAWLRSHQIKIALNTGFYREVTDIILNRLGWDLGLDSRYVGTSESMIQASVTPSEIYQQEGRPAPYLIQKAMYLLGIQDPQTVVTVGDTPADLAAGINAHCRWALGVTNGTHTHQALEGHPNHGLLQSLRELPPKILEGNAVFDSSLFLP